MNLKCTALTRFRNDCQEWLIVSGVMIGCWTCTFGIDCLTDNNQEYVRDKKKETPGRAIIDFEITSVGCFVPEPNFDHQS